MESIGTGLGTDDDREVPAPDPGETVLLLSSAMEQPPSPECLSAPGVSARAANVVTLSLSESVQSVIDEWRATPGGLPARLAVVSIDESQRQAAASPPSGGGDSPASGASNVSTAAVSSPSDLTGLGIKLSQCLSAWEGEENPTIVEVDSLTTLLQFAELERVFQFVHMLTGRIGSSGAVGFFHLDPGAHDEQTVATLRALFDMAYEYGQNGWREP